MASSPEILAPPHEIPAGPGQREHWADNLRVLVIAVVVVWHTATAYLGGTHWYYLDRSTSKVWAAVFVPAWLISAFALAPLFLVAGWFSARSLARKAAGGFARSRLLRLGVPLIVFIFLINPLASYLGNLRGAPPEPGGLPGRDVRSCWPSHWPMPCSGVCTRRQVRATGPRRRSWWPPPS